MVSETCFSSEMKCASLARMIMACVILLTLCCGAQAADRFEPVREHIRAGMVDQSVPSMAVAVARDGRIVWEEAFGWADRERRLPADAHTPYSLASISKPMTATGLMALVRAGKVDLDAPANRYLGYAKLQALVGDAQAATVRRVADHSSGLPVHWQWFYSDEARQLPSMDETILRYGRLVTLPGERYEYANVGYGLLGYIISRVSGLEFSEYMRREVFLPLGMTRTSVGIGPGLAPFAATRYGADRQPIPFYDSDTPGAAAIFSSVHDVVRFGMFHLKAHLHDQKVILVDVQIDEMHRPSSLEADRVNGYGIGFRIGERNGHQFIGHSGSMPGVSTQMMLLPKQKLVVVVLSNSSNLLVASTVDRILGIHLPGWSEAPAVPPPSAFRPSSELVGSWKGSVSTYVKELPFELHIRRDGEILARVGEQPASLVEEARIVAGQLRGKFASRLGTPDSDYFDYTLNLALTLRGDILNGGLTSIGVRHPRQRNAMTHWVSLQRQMPP